MCRINKRARLTFWVIYVQIYVSSPPPYFWLFNNIQNFKPNPILCCPFPIKIWIYRLTMTMLTRIDCRRWSNHSPYIQGLNIYLKERIPTEHKYFRTDLFNCPSSGVDTSAIKDKLRMIQEISSLEKVKTHKITSSCYKKTPKRGCFLAALCWRRVRVDGDQVLDAPHYLDL